jgi:RNA polymerase subunit RPABC4/transcription elongation factor Spt4
VPTFRSVTVEVATEGGARCPHCAALVHGDSAWCSLCYADLRPAPQPSALPAPQPSALPAPQQPVPPQTGAFDPLTAPLGLLAGVAGSEPAVAAVATAESATASSEAWPCLHCGVRVPLEENACPSCGTGFLEGAIPGEATLGRLGNAAASKQTKAFIMIGGSVGLLGVLLALMYVLGAVL